MKRVINTAVSLAVVMLVVLAASLHPAYAGVADECRQEAQDYGVAPELSAQYIQDCIASRGGAVPADMEAGEVTESPVVVDELPSGEENPQPL